MTDDGLFVKLLKRQEFLMIQVGIFLLRFDCTVFLIPERSMIADTATERESLVYGL
jgi:hypothetical protein